MGIGACELGGSRWNAESGGSLRGSYMGLGLRNKWFYFANRSLVEEEI